MSRAGRKGKFAGCESLNFREDLVNIPRNRPCVSRNNQLSEPPPTLYTFQTNIYGQIQWVNWLHQRDRELTQITPPFDLQYGQEALCLPQGYGRLRGIRFFRSGNSHHPSPIHPVLSHIRPHRV